MQKVAVRFLDIKKRNPSFSRPRQSISQFIHVPPKQKVFSPWLVFLFPLCAFSLTYVFASYANKEKGNSLQASAVQAVQGDSSQVLLLSNTSASTPEFKNSSGNIAIDTSESNLFLHASLPDPATIGKNGWLYEAWLIDKSHTDLITSLGMLDSRGQLEFSYAHMDTIFHGIIQITLEPLDSDPQPSSIVALSADTSAFAPQQPHTQVAPTPFIFSGQVIPLEKTSDAVDRGSIFGAAAIRPDISSISIDARLPEGTYRVWLKSRDQGMMNLGVLQASGDQTNEFKTYRLTYQAQYVHLNSFDQIIISQLDNTKLLIGNISL